MELSRNKLQEASMAIIYDAILYIEMGESFDIKNIISNNLDTPIEECPLYVKEVCYNVILHYQEMYDSFDKLTIKWKFSRLNHIAQAILLLSYSHYYYVKDSDRNVVISIAVKLAKKYLDNDEYKFINAILEKALC